MSKTQLKKYLKTLDHDQLVQVVLDLYDARKDAKEYLEFYMNPDIEATLEKEKKKLQRNYFTSQGRTKARMSIKEGNEIISDFIKLDAPPEAVAEMLVYHIELLVSRMIMRHIQRQTAWTSAVGMFQKAADYIASYGLERQFARRLSRIINYVKSAPKWEKVPERMRQAASEAGLTLNEPSDDDDLLTDDETV